MPYVLLIFPTVTTLTLSVLWPMCMKWAPSKTRFVFCFFFGFIVLMEIVQSLSKDPDSFFYRQAEYNGVFMNFTSSYIILMGYFSYCEFNLCLLFYTPLYLVGSFIISTTTDQIVEEIRETLPEENQYFLQPTLQFNQSIVMLISFSLLLARYQ